MRTAAGFILYSHVDGQIEYLLLRNARHGTWSFPKGHLEEGEDAATGARRELLEETGLDQIRVIPDFELELLYPVDVERHGQREQYDKRTLLFLARAESRDWTRSSEHDEGGWMSAEQALATLQHAALKDALLRAMSQVAATDPPR